MNAGRWPRLRKLGPIIAAALALVGACGGLSAHYWPAPSEAQTVGVQNLQLSETVMRSAVASVFGANPTYQVLRVSPSTNLGGDLVDLATPHGLLTLLQPGGQILSGIMTDVPTGVALSSPSVAVAGATALVARVFPWATSLPMSEPTLVDHGESKSYQITWRATVNGMLQPSWVIVTTNESGQVTGFVANSFASVPVTVAVDQAHAVAIAQQQVTPGSTLAHADLRQALVSGVMRTYWTIDLAPPPPTQSGYRLAGLTEIVVDAVTGEVLSS
jgi:hypothetical protein